MKKDSKKNRDAMFGVASKIARPRKGMPPKRVSEQSDRNFAKEEGKEDPPSKTTLYTLSPRSVRGQERGGGRKLDSPAGVCDRRRPNPFHPSSRSIPGGDTRLFKKKEKDEGEGEARGEERKGMERKEEERMERTEEIGYL